MKNAKGLAKNPLGIIALFVSLIYGFACLVLSSSISNLEGPDERLPLIWFVIVFPVIILIAFIILVVKHHEKLYAPSDYSNEDLFLTTFKDKGKEYQETQVQVTKENLKDKSDLKDAIRKSDNTDFNDVLFSEQGKTNLDLANKTFSSIRESLSDLLESNIVSGFGFGVQSPEYYICSIKFGKDFLQEGKTDEETIIIRVTEYGNDNYAIIGIGKGLIEDDPDKFGERLREYLITKFLPKIMKPDELKKITVPNNG